jgi:hypothetical protein
MHAYTYTHVNVHTYTGGTTGTASHTIGSYQAAAYRPTTAPQSDGTYHSHRDQTPPRSQATVVKHDALAGSSGTGQVVTFDRTAPRAYVSQSRESQVRDDMQLQVQRALDRNRGRVEVKMNHASGAVAVGASDGLEAYTRAVRAASPDALNASSLLDSYLKRTS